MESRVSYAAVGGFVVVLSAVLVAMGLWIGSGITGKNYDRYSIYFRESVSGLNRNAPVRYHGVVVGRVEEIALAPNDPGQVHLVIAVEEKTPIKTDTMAQLDPQGVTGILNIELTGGSAEAPLLEPARGKPYPVIPSKPSFISRLDDALSRGLEDLERLSGQVSQVLSAENQASLSATLKNLEAFTAKLASNGDRLERTLALAEQTLAGSASAAEQWPAALTELRRTLERWDALGEDFGKTSTEVRNAAETAHREFTSIGHETLPRLNEMVAEMRSLSASLTRLSEELRENPRMLLFGRPDPSPGPGER